jgi:uncharacterized protein (UPF0548 family)
MIMFRPISPQQLVDYHSRVTELPWSYPQIGATRRQPPAGYDHDVSEVDLGKGEAVYRAACDGLRQWAMFPRTIAHVYPRPAEIKPGQVVAVGLETPLVNAIGACRIVYRIDESVESIRSKSTAVPYRARFGFAYGTLTEHVECGEELFLVTWHRDDRVTYRLECFSRPQHWFARLGYVYARWQQRRFRALSGRAMQAFVAQSQTSSARHRDEIIAATAREFVPSADG